MITVIPVKPANEAKRRLAGVLDPDRRAALARRLLAHTVSVARRIGPVVVVSRGEDMLALARELGAVGLREDGHDLDAAVRQGVAWAARRGDTVVVVPSDLPRLQAADLEGVVAAADGLEQAVVVAPCQRDDGTNALLLRPPDVVGPAFGPNSAARHVAAATQAGIPVRRVHSAGLVDLDTPADLAAHPLG